MIHIFISVDLIGDHHIIRKRSLTGQRYRYEILRPLVVLYVVAIGNDVMLMGNNCRKHLEHLVDVFLFEEIITWIESPDSVQETNSACLGHFRHTNCWKFIIPTSYPRTGKASYGEVKIISYFHINRLIDSMPKSYSCYWSPPETYLLLKMILFEGNTLFIRFFHMQKLCFFFCAHISNSMIFFYQSYVLVFSYIAYQVCRSCINHINNSPALRSTHNINIL